MAVDDKFIIQQQGRDYVLFAGLLNEAHERGLRSITTEITKLVMDGDTPTFALVKASVGMKDGETFEGYGDANTSNVNRNVGKHLIRMAETRAKARALRDAVNIGITAFDEIGGSEAGDESDHQQPRRRTERPARDQRNSSKGSATTSNGRATTEPENAERITTEQRRRITELAQDFYPDGLRELQMKVLKGQQVSRLTQQNAQKIIRRLEVEIKTRDDAMGGGSPTDEDTGDVDFDKEDFGDVDSYSRGVPSHG